MEAFVLTVLIIFAIATLIALAIISWCAAIDMVYGVKESRKSFNLKSYNEGHYRCALKIYKDLQEIIKSGEIEGYPFVKTEPTPMGVAVMNLETLSEIRDYLLGLSSELRKEKK